MEAIRTLNDLHKEHKQWLGKLSFYRDELYAIQSKLTDLVKRKLSREEMAFLDHFQNRLVLENNQIDVLTHDLKVFEKKLRDKEKEKPGETIAGKDVEHPNFSARLARFDILFNELRTEFIDFLGKVT